jgi:hypothetical protein
MAKNSMKPWFLTWISGFFAVPALLHIVRMAFQLEVIIGGFKVPMVWSNAIIAASIITSAAFLLAAAQNHSKIEVAEKKTIKPKKLVQKKPVVGAYGSEDFEGEDSIIE